MSDIVFLLTISNVQIKVTSKPEVSANIKQAIQELEERGIVKVKKKVIV